MTVAAVEAGGFTGTIVGAELATLRLPAK